MGGGEWNMREREEGLWTTERALIPDLGAGATGGFRQASHAPPLTVEAHLFTFGASYLLSTEAGSPMTRRDQSLGLGGRNPPQVRGTTQSAVHGTFIQVYPESDGSRGR